MGLIHHYGQDIRGHMAARGSAVTHKQWQRQRIGGAFQSKWSSTGVDG